MAAHIFEVAYNSVIHLAATEMAGKGARAMLDYRCEATQSFRLHARLGWGLWAPCGVSASCNEQAGIGSGRAFGDTQTQWTW